MVRNNGRSLVDVCATYGTLSLRIDYQPPGQKPRFARCLQKGDVDNLSTEIAYLSTGYKSAK